MFCYNIQRNCCDLTCSNLCVYCLRRRTQLLRRAGRVSGSELREPRERASNSERSSSARREELSLGNDLGWTVDEAEQKKFQELADRVAADIAEREGKPQHIPEQPSFPLGYCWSPGGPL